MKALKKMAIETNAPDNYMVEILCRIRQSVYNGKYSGKGEVSRVNKVVYHYSYTYSV